MRFACGDMRDHIVSYQNDHRPSYWRRRALRQQERLRIDFREIFGLLRFSTFATISARNGHAEVSWRCPFIGGDRKWRHRGQNDALKTQIGNAIRSTGAPLRALRHLHKPLIASQRRRSSAAAGFRTLPRSALFESQRSLKWQECDLGLLY